MWAPPQLECGGHFHARRCCSRQREQRRFFATWLARSSHAAPAAGVGLAAVRVTHMTKLFPLRVKRPERVCWGCARLCPATDMACGNGKERTEHPSELFGDDWFETGLQPTAAANEPVVAGARAAAPGGPSTSSLRPAPA